MDQDVDTDEDDVDWDEYELEDNDVYEISDPNDPNKEDEVVYFKYAINILHSQQNQTYQNIINKVGNDKEAIVIKAVSD